MEPNTRPKTQGDLHVWYEAEQFLSEDFHWIQCQVYTLKECTDCHTNGHRRISEEERKKYVSHRRERHVREVRVIMGATVGQQIDHWIFTIPMHYLTRKTHIFLLEKDFVLSPLGFFPQKVLTTPMGCSSEEVAFCPSMHTKTWLLYYVPVAHRKKIPDRSRSWNPNQCWGRSVIPIQGTNTRPIPIDRNKLSSLPARTTGR